MAHYTFDAHLGVRTMAHQFTCTACGFQVQSEDDDEVIDFVKNHADSKHDMNLSTSDVRDGLKQVST
jgi:predicted small metal-binding protein